ncbi:MAG: SUMF1/EgtB/PvdO family nonheme iron enzyme [Vicinamibacterales bacterium]
MAKTAGSVRRVPEVRIFISSPGDVEDERRTALALVQRLEKDPAFRDFKLRPFLWEDPEAPTPMLAHETPQDSVNRVLRPKDCEIVVVILWSRMGTPLVAPLKPDGSPYLSGTEFEYQEAVADAEEAGRVVLVYRCTREPQVSLRDSKYQEKQRQLALVDEFFGGLQAAGRGHNPFDTVEVFKARLESHLRELVPRFSRRNRTPSKARSPRDQRKSAPLVPDAYRAWLKKETGTLELLGLSGAQGRSLFLSSVYVPIVTLRSEERRERMTRIDAEGDMREQADLLLHALGHRSLYVPGGPGFGKSTFCSWVAWLACEGAMPVSDVDPPPEFTESLPRSLTGRLPVLVRLRYFWEELAKGTRKRTFSAAELATSLDAWLGAQVPPGARVELADFIEHGLGLFIFDGVDEVPAETKNGECYPKELLLNALSQAVKQWIPKGNVLLVTSRPYGLSVDEFNRLGLEEAPIADLPGDMQQLLVRRWFRIQKQDAEKGDVQAADLTRDIGEREWLQPLAANPLMLSAMCAIYSDGGRLPQDRHQLYDKIVESVLTKRYPDPNRRSHARFELGAIAYAMHTGDAFGTAHTAPAPQATIHEAETALAKDEGAGTLRDRVLGPREALLDLLTQSGLLTGGGEARVAFYHLSIQEFLAAERLFELRNESLGSAMLDHGEVPAWRNTLSFLFGRLLAAFSVPTRAIDLLGQVVGEIDSTKYGTQLVAADCAEMLQAKGVRLRQDPDEKLRRELLASMTTRASAAERCDAGTALGKIGDPRFDADRWFLPVEDDAPLGFLRVPAGPFTMGSARSKDRYAQDDETLHTVDLPEFYVARYPVTVAQFARFVTESGFSVGDRDCLRGVPNHPVVSVSWHEALAYCDWLTDRLRAWTDAPPGIQSWLDATLRDGWCVTLPSEAEWEKAARGDDGRVYPWGDSIEPDRLNCYDTGIGRTSSVGAFPSGASPFAALDMAGNVWEWTRSHHKAYPYNADDGRENLKAGNDVRRVVRGGSFRNLVDFVRAAIRDCDSPVYRDDYVGFRLVVSCSSS